MSNDKQCGASVRVGDILAGKYEVEGLLGSGGMGEVVAARHLQLGRRVAIKFLLPPACENAEAATRFLREAQAAVAIESEHIAKVIDVGMLESGAPYMVMEFLDGVDLSVIVRKRGPLPVEESVDYVLQACEAIAEAHALGIVHRDLKPANLFVTQRKDGTALVKVLDFGISKINKLAPDGALQADMTSTHSVLGSPLYMSPEQMRSSKHVDARTDIWSLGVILYELLSGRPVFSATTLPGLCSMIATETPVSLRDGRPEFPAALEDVVMGCLEKKPENRIRDVAVLATKLLPFGSKECRLSVERIARILQAAPLAVITQDSSATRRSGPVEALWRRTTSPRHKRTRVVVVIALSAVFLAAAGAIAVPLWKRPVASDASPSARAATDTPAAVPSESSALTGKPASTDTAATSSAEPNAAAKASAAASMSRKHGTSSPAPTSAGPASASPPAPPPVPATHTSPTYNPLDHL